VTAADGEQVGVRVGRLALAAAIAGGALLLAPAPVTAATIGPAYAAVGFSGDGTTLIVGHLGGAARTIYRGDQPASVEEPTVSPDGRRVAFVDIEGSSSARIAVINFDGTGHRYLTGSVTDRDLSTPVWSRDGRWIYFGCRSYARSAFYAAYRVPADGSSRMTALSHGSNERPESLSSDGTRLVFDMMVSGERWQRTGVMAVNGTSRQRVGGTNLWQATWRPRTSTLAVSRVLRDSNDAVTIQIQLLNIGTGRYHALSATQSPSTYGAAYPLAWNGGWLYYLHYDYRNGNQVHPRIYKIKPDGTARTDVTPRLSGWQGPFSVQGR
jgi:Tol biopolymer transport system component